MEAASYADGSVGWVRDDRRLLRHVRRDAPRSRGLCAITATPTTISAGAFRPDGVAVEVDGGLPGLRTLWPLASGSSHATWYVGGCVVLRRRWDLSIGPTGYAADAGGVLPGVRRPRSSIPGIRPASGGWPVTTSAVHRRDRADCHLHGVVPGAAHGRPTAVPHAADRDVRHVHQRGVAGIARHAIEESSPWLDTKSVTLVDRQVAADKLDGAGTGSAAPTCSLIPVVVTSLAHPRSAILWLEVEAGGHPPTMADRGAVCGSPQRTPRTVLSGAIRSAVLGAGGVEQPSTRNVRVGPMLARRPHGGPTHRDPQEVNFELAGRPPARAWTSALEPVDDRLPRPGLRFVADRGVRAARNCREHLGRLGGGHGPLGE